MRNTTQTQIEGPSLLVGLHPTSNLPKCQSHEKQERLKQGEIDWSRLRGHDN